MPPMLLAKEKSDHEGRVAPPTWLASWMRARITNEMTDAYSIKISVVCTHTEGRRPQIEIQSSTPMMAAAISQVTALGNVELGDTTNSRYAAARGMFPMLHSVA